MMAWFHRHASHGPLLVLSSRSQSVISSSDSSQEAPAAPSVKERVDQIETGDARIRDVEVDKPKKKKPSSRAFEEFESSGVIISFVSTADIGV